MNKLFDPIQTLTVNFKHSRLGDISLGDQVVVGQAEELPPVLLVDPPDGQAEGHVAVIAHPRSLTQVSPIRPTPGHCVLAEQKYCKKVCLTKNCQTLKLQVEFDSNRKYILPTNGLMT